MITLYRIPKRKKLKIDIRSEVENRRLRNKREIDILVYLTVKKVIGNYRLD